MLATFSIQAQEVTLDFTENVWNLPVGSSNKQTAAADFTNGTYTITLTAGVGYYYNTDKYLMLGQKDATLTLPAFDFAVSKIKVYGRSKASGYVTENIFVGDVAVSEEKTSAKEDHEFDINENYRAAGNIYTLKVTNGYNTQITKIEVYKYDATATAKPEISTPDNATTFEESLEVTITAAEGAKIYYTLDGSEPTTGSTEYTAAFTINATTTVKAIAVANGKASDVVSTEYIKHVNGSVADAIAAYKDGAKIPAVITGYIVGAVDGSKMNENSQFSNTTTVASNILIADDADETDYTKCIPVQLSSGTDARTALNLKDNKSNYKKQVILTGSLEYYFGQAGLKSLTAYEIVGGGEEGGEDGSEEEPVVPEEMDIESVINAGADAYVKTVGLVIATNSSSILLNDGTASILVFFGAAHEYNSGDVLIVTGKTSTYNGMVQFTKDAVIEKNGTETVEHSEVEVMDGAAMDAFLQNFSIKYIEYTGVLTINGNYYNVAVEGASTAVGSIYYPNEGILPEGAVTGATVKVTGYTVGISSSKYVNTMTLNVEVIEEEEEEPTEPETPAIAALEVSSVERSPLPDDSHPERAYELQGVKLFFNENVWKYTTKSTGDYGYILDSEGKEVVKLDMIMGANGTLQYAAPCTKNKITTPGTYTVVVNPDVIVVKEVVDGKATDKILKSFAGGQWDFTVEAKEVKDTVVIFPSYEDGLCYNSSFTTTEEFKEFTITVRNAENITINADKKVVLNKVIKEGFAVVGTEAVAEATVTVEDYNATTKFVRITFPDQEYAEGSYSFIVPAGLLTIDEVENNEYVESTFTYKKPSLSITKDYTSWESYLTEEWQLPLSKEIVISISHAESVTIDENKIATISIGDNTYNASVVLTEDKDENNENLEGKWWITFTFEGYEFTYEKGEYTFTVPAGLYTVNGEANSEESKKFTYGDPIAVEEFTVTSITPTAGTVSSLAEISITFSNSSIKPEMLVLTNGEYYAPDASKPEELLPCRFNFILKNGVYVSVDNNYNVAPITEAGTYTLDLSELEGLTGEKVFTWTVEEAEDTAIDGVEAEAENAVIYDLTGRRVNEIVKGGIYIINGKKVLVK